MAISKERKEEVLSQYADWMKRSQAVILVEYTGVKMKDLDNIRAKIRDRVVNSMWSRIRWRAVPLQTWECNSQ